MNRFRLRFCFFLAPKKVSKPEIENRPFPLEWLPDTPLLCDIVNIVLFILNLPCRPFFLPGESASMLIRIRENSQPKTKIAFRYFSITYQPFRFVLCKWRNRQNSFASIRLEDGFERDASLRLLQARLSIVYKQKSTIGWFWRQGCLG